MCLRPGTLVSYASVTRNIATYNAQLGIRALAGVIDGGGNKAADNGDPDQCEGLACTMAKLPTSPPGPHVSVPRA
ncbi:hypothetical protein [Intrasporangium calvum]|uniref:Uncharacterized protein n=1 Tax=Intrasporangium calvum (strain ATCC 23552 / DSM 43043 / JCM 3097 / NBRC 12989 / NCIMB 10167 / NRRL B-3866 / 7 KIP) TaxID=710696 RepID=E6SAT8_INTC7|nr:hypothetical protein [Intrasporangium calvum]ADU49399.1 hypothetical protein Intca_2904 [Intrasporangium calvum DSM 43043]